MAKEYISRDEMIEQIKARVVLGAPKFNTGNWNTGIRVGGQDDV